MRVERHDSRPNQITTLVAKSIDGAVMARTVGLGDDAAIGPAIRELTAMIELHDRDATASWGRLVAQVIKELVEEVATPRTHICGAACPVRVVYVSCSADDKTISAQAIQDGSPEDASRLDEVRRSVALSVLGIRNINIQNHRFWLTDDFETATHA